MDVSLFSISTTTTTMEASNRSHVDSWTHTHTHAANTLCYHFVCLLILQCALIESNRCNIELHMKQSLNENKLNPWYQSLRWICWCQILAEQMRLEWRFVLLCICCSIHSFVYSFSAVRISVLSLPVIYCLFLLEWCMWCSFSGFIWRI